MPIVKTILKTRVFPSAFFAWWLLHMEEFCEDTYTIHMFLYIFCFYSFSVDALRLSFR